MKSPIMRSPFMSSSIMISPIMKSAIMRSPIVKHDKKCATDDGGRAYFFPVKTERTNNKIASAYAIFGSFQSNGEN